jgi:hypothetical protein
LTPYFLDEGSSPGQTAKLIGLSAAGLHLAVEIGREDQGKGVGGLGRDRRRLSPERERKGGDHQESKEKMLHKPSFSGDSE